MATIRAVSVRDADRLSVINVVAWQQAYRGMIDDDYLDALRPNSRADGWRTHLGNESNPLTTIAYDNGGLRGYVTFGPNRSGGGGEVVAMYVDPSAWNTGIGTQLMAAAELALSKDFDEAYLWVLRDNTRARHFYERCGWEHTEVDKEEVIHGISAVDTQYRKSLAIQL